MGYLSNVSNSDDYPYWIDDLVEDYNLDISISDVLNELSERGGNISNAFINIVSKFSPFFIHPF